MVTKFPRKGLPHGAPSAQAQNWPNHRWANLDCHSRKPKAVSSHGSENRPHRTPECSSGVFFRTTVALVHRDCLMRLLFIYRLNGFIHHFTLHNVSTIEGLRDDLLTAWSSVWEDGIHHLSRRRKAHLEVAAGGYCVIAPRRARAECGTEASGRKDIWGPCCLHWKTR